MFSSIQPPSLSSRIGSLAVVPFATYVLANAYFSTVPLLPAVPRWLFELVRLILLGGVLVPTVAAVRLVVRRDCGLTGRAGLALVVLAAGVSLSALTLLQMSLPWLFG